MAEGSDGDLRVHDTFGGFSSCRRHGLKVAQDMVLGIRWVGHWLSPVGTTEPTRSHQPSLRDFG